MKVSLPQQLFTSLLLVVSINIVSCTQRHKRPARVPVTDFHMHLSAESTKTAVYILKRAGVDTIVNLRGSPYGRRLGAALAQARTLHKAGIEALVFAGIPWRYRHEADFGELAADDLRRSVAAGARGLKVSKVFGLVARDSTGTLIPVDTPRLNALWDVAAELNIPVAIHTGDPLAFFSPPTKDNERYEELKAHPGWSFYGKDFPSLEELLAARDRLVAAHPRTIFVAVHVGGFPERLDSVAHSMAKLPNLWIDIAARLPALGRHPPEQVRRFFERFSDRILFGTDLQIGTRHIILGSGGDDDSPSKNNAVAYYESHWKYLETNALQMTHLTPIQGKWKIDAIGLPQAVLNKLYRENAHRLLNINEIKKGAR